MFGNLVTREPPRPDEEFSPCVSTQTRLDQGVCAIKRHTSKDFQKLSGKKCSNWCTAAVGDLELAFCVGGDDAHLWVRVTIPHKANTTSTSELELRGCIGCLEVVGDWQGEMLRPIFTFSAVGKLSGLVG